MTKLIISIILTLSLTGCNVFRDSDTYEVRGVFLEIMSSNRIKVYTFTNVRDVEEIKITKTQYDKFYKMKVPKIIDMKIKRVNNNTINVYELLDYKIIEEEN